MLDTDQIYFISNLNYWLDKFRCNRKPINLFYNLIGKRVVSWIQHYWHKIDGEVLSSSLFSINVKTFDLVSPIVSQISELYNWLPFYRWKRRVLFYAFWFQKFSGILEFATVSEDHFRLQVKYLVVFIAVLVFK